MRAIIVRVMAAQSTWSWQRAPFLNSLTAKAFLSSLFSFWLSMAKLSNLLLLFPLLFLLFINGLLILNCCCCCRVVLCVCVWVYFLDLKGFHNRLSLSRNFLGSISLLEWRRQTINRYTDRQVNRSNDRQIDKQTDRQKDSEKGIPWHCIYRKSLVSCCWPWPGWGGIITKFIEQVFQLQTEFGRNRFDGS